MDKKSKRISGLKAGKIIQKANKYFSEPEKHFIIQELLSTKPAKGFFYVIYDGFIAMLKIIHVVFRIIFKEKILF